ncbi:MAG: serine/threonine-protein kinase [Proteobacteria bacterium]|nr:serine/threonine-protein kinase [Pseudomonadota bacterium]
MSDKPIDPGLELRIGKYEIQKQLGQGATGTVYLATDTFSGSEVALKTIDPALFRDPEFGAEYRTQFLNEASLAGKLRHPHIVGILDAVVEEDSGYIAMELVMGGDLAERSSVDTLLSVGDVMQVGFKCCGALDYAFQEGIFHRDIKPANIMVAKGTEVKIADFGAAFLRRSQSAQTVAMGSPYYMSPEQIDGLEPTYHSDMYSMGVVLYELLTGQKPFSAGSLEMLLQKIQHQVPPAPGTLRAGIPAEVDAIVMKALQKKPLDRYDYYDEFAMDLARAALLVTPPEIISDSEQYVALKRCETLAELSDSELWELARAARWSRVPKGTVILNESDEGDSMFFMADGSAQVRREGRVLNTIAQSECFGEIAYINGGAVVRHATVTAIEDCLLAEFRPFVLMQVSAGAQLQLMRTLVRNLSDRLQVANTKNTA